MNIKWNSDEVKDNAIRGKGNGTKACVQVEPVRRA